MTQRAPRIVILNPNTNAETTRQMVTIAAQFAPKGASVEGHTVATGAALITTPDELACAAQAVCREATALECADGVVVAAFGDPGLHSLRRLLSVPVVGLAEASMAQAAAYGRFTVVTTTPKLVAPIEQHAADYGHAAELIGVRVPECDPAQLMADPAALIAAMRACIDTAVARDGAKAVIIGGGPLARAARRLAQDCPVPLLEPVPVAVQHLANRLPQALQDAPSYGRTGGGAGNLEGE